MSNLESKGQSPFFPGQPAPVELFVGRAIEVKRILRAASQVAAGKPQAIFISGEYGIGKSSLARFVRFLAEKQHRLLGFHALLGTSRSVEDVAQSVVRSVLESPTSRESTTAALRAFLAEYVGEQSLFGVTLRLDKLKRDAPDLSRGFLPFLRQIFLRSQESFRGVLLVLDELNGLASNPQFSFFLKDLVDSNALSNEPVPLFLILCGTEERRHQLIENHRPVERIFEVAQIEPMTDTEMREFFVRSFDRAEISLDREALDIFCHYSGGLPKLMHLIGDAAFWASEDRRIGLDTAWSAIFSAMEDVGRKFVDPQVHQALRSPNYRSILRKLSKALPSLPEPFQKQQIVALLEEGEQKNLDNFLQRMKKLQVLIPGEERGSYRFRDRLTTLYLAMQGSDDAFRRSS